MQACLIAGRMAFGAVSDAVKMLERGDGYGTCVSAYETTLLSITLLYVRLVRS